MRGLSTVLCAVDGGEPGRMACAQALALARAHDATLLIVHPRSLERPFNAGAVTRVRYLQALSASGRAAGAGRSVLAVPAHGAAVPAALHRRAA